MQHVRDALFRTALQQRRSQRRHSLRIAGVEFDRAPQHTDATLVIAHIREGAAGISQNVRILAVQLNRGLRRPCCLLPPAFTMNQSHQMPYRENQ